MTETEQRQHTVAALIPGDSLIHRLHPMAKLAWVLAILFFAFMIRHAWLLFGLTIIGILLVAYSRTMSGYLRSMVIILPIALGLIFLQSVAPAFPRPWTPITSVGPFTLFQEGVYNGLLLTSRVTTAATFALLVVQTTHPGDMSVALERIKVPYQFNFMVVTTLQLIPIFQRELQIIFSAQQSRGMRAKGFGALLPSLVPIFAGAIERVQQLSTSLESRAFGSAGDKSHLREVTTRPIDIIVSLAALALLVSAFVLFFRFDALNIARDVVFTPVVAVTVGIGAGVLFLLMLAAAFVKMRSIGG